MSFDLIIKNGTVILENEARVIDIAVQGGKIAAIGESSGKRKTCWMRRD
ncbi:Allantoinase [Salmonella enterica subsp. enterica serovar Napoli]|nr:Allantoinase [Salmonella enterica subsp. enterica serovar Napoli]